MPKKESSVTPLKPGNDTSAELVLGQRGDPKASYAMD